MKRKKNFISFVGLKNIMRQGISLSPVLSTRVVTSYILVIINPFSTQDIIRISSRSLNADHNSDPCHAKKKKNRYSLQYSSLFTKARLVISNPISYDPLF